MLQKKVYGKPLVYLDNAATSLTPIDVINTVKEYYTNYSSNIHRGAYYTSMIVSDLYESTRKTVASFINADYSESIVFTKGTTEAINFIASTFIRKNIKEGEEIVTSIMEHHANIIPWQEICKDTKTTLKFLYLNKKGEINWDHFISIISSKTKFIALSHVSSVLGTINNIYEIIKYAHSKGIYVLIDGAQAVPHIKVDVSYLNPDFYVFSAHKMYGPTGVGVLYIKKTLIDCIHPYQTGGGMINSVNTKQAFYAVAPQKFEAGTPNISGVLGLQSAINYINKIGWKTIEGIESELYNFTHKLLVKNSELQIIGQASAKIGVFSFILNNIHPHDIASILDKEGIAVRSGNMCAEPLMNYLNINGVTRISLSFYNTEKEIQLLNTTLNNIIRIFKK